MACADARGRDVDLMMVMMMVMEFGRGNFELLNGVGMRAENGLWVSTWRCDWGGPCKKLDVGGAVQKSGRVKVLGVPLTKLATSRASGDNKTRKKKVTHIIIRVDQTTC